MQKRRFLCFVLCLILVFSQAISITAQTESTTKIKNLIYMIPDGGGMAPFFLADKVKQNGGFSKEVYPDLTEVETGEMYIKQYLVGAEVVSDKVVVDGKIITGKGAGAAAEFGFEIVKLLQNRAVADELKGKMQYWKKKNYDR